MLTRLNLATAHAYLRMFKTIALLSIIILLLASCAKDAITQPEELSSKPKTVKESKFCQITKVTGYEPWSLHPRVFIFEYNEKGDPLRITPSIVSTGSPKHEFRYDKKGRLTDYIGPYNNGAFEFWAKYTYDNQDRIVSDVTYIFGNYGEEPTNDYLSLRQQHAYEYDQQNRITKVITNYPFAPYPGNTQEYSYDQSGNRMAPGVAYNNSPNPLRTNSIWMFLSRDYSMDNPYPATSYNDNGMPTTIAVPLSKYLIVGSLVPHFIEYSCKGGGNKN